MAKLRQKKPGNVVSVGPVWLSKSIKDGPNRKERRAAFKRLRHMLGSRVWHARVKTYALNQQLAWFAEQKKKAQERVANKFAKTMAKAIDDLVVDKYVGQHA